MVMSIPVLDRIATLGMRGAGERNIYGEWEAGALTEIQIWGCLKLADFQDMLHEAGRRQVADLEFLTRYRADILAADTYEDWRLTLDGVTYHITGAQELAKYGRRRYMKIEGEETLPDEEC